MIEWNDVILRRYKVLFQRKKRKSNLRRSVGVTLETNRQKLNSVKNSHGSVLGRHTQDRKVISKLYGQENG